MIVGRPFEEFDLRDELRLEPAAFFHVLGCQAFAPSALTRFGKIPKRGFGDRQTLEIREERPPRSWSEAVSECGWRTLNHVPRNTRPGSSRRLRDPAGIRQSRIPDLD